jgi:hypothetical protein
MRTALVVVLLLASVFATSNYISLAESRTTGEAQTAASPSLKLRLKLTSSQYCVGDEELDRLDLKMRFVYENSGSLPVILYKSSPMPARLMIARTVEAAVAEKFELDFTQTWYSTKGSDEGSNCYQGVAPTNCFLTVAPGASYEADGEVGVFVVRGDVRDIEGAVKSGEHVLQLVIPTWNESYKLAQEVERRWRSHGSLWSKPLKSEPLAFTVDKERTVIECK